MRSRIFLLILTLAFATAISAQRRVFIDPAAADLQTEPAQVWQFDVTRPSRTTPTYAEGMVYFGTEAGTLYAVDAESGAEMWQFDIDEPIVSTAAVAEGVLYVGGLDNVVYALDAVEGTVIWQTETDGQVYSSPALAEDALFIGSRDDNLYALDRENGAILWTFDTGGEVWSSPAVDGERVYIGSRSGAVFALDVTTGDEIWRYEDFTETVQINASPVLADEAVIISNMAGEFVGLDAATGELLWWVTLDSAIYASAAVHDNLIVITTFDGEIYAYQRIQDALAEISLLWQASIGGPAYSSPVIISDGESALTVLQSTEEGGLLHAIDAVTGESLWAIVTGRAWDFRSSSPILVDGTLYVTSNSEGLLAYR